MTSNSFALGRGKECRSGETCSTWLYPSSVSIRQVEPDSTVADAEMLRCLGDSRRLLPLLYLDMP